MMNIKCQPQVDYIQLDQTIRLCIGLIWLLHKMKKKFSHYSPSIIQLRMISYRLRGKVENVSQRLLR